MRLYEVVYIHDPALEESAVTAKLEKLHELATSQGGETPTNAPPEFQGSKGRRRRMEGPRITLLNYKDVSTLSHFVTEQGKILPKRTTKVTAGFQRQLGRAVKRARYLALLPYTRRNDG